MIALVFVAPLGFLVVRTAALGGVALEVLVGQSLGPLLRTLGLAGAVTCATAALGLATAWLVARTDLPGRRAWALVLALPLVLPSYIGAFALQAAFATGGLASGLMGGARLPRIEGFWAAFAVLTLLTFPYVLLPVAARLRQVPAALDETSRLLGRGAWRTFAEVTWPQVRGAVLAGALLVFLYVVSDFGAVQILRVDTLTRAVYANVLDQPTSLTLSLQLGLLAVSLAAGERAVEVAGRRGGTLARGTRALRVPLGRWSAAALPGLVLVVLCSLLAPVAVLAGWALRGLAQGTAEASAIAADPARLVAPLLHSAGVALAAAAVAAVAVLPVAWLTAGSRRGGRLASAANAAVVGGFALPGLVVALALVAASLRGPALLAGAYQTLPLLVLAYVVHYGAQALRATQVGMASLPPRVPDAARMLGAGRLRRLLQVELPLLAPAALAGAGLVLLSTLKELPATLLLAPTGFPTLATQIWDATEFAFWADASILALVLIALSGTLTWFLVLRRADALA